MARAKTNTAMLRRPSHKLSRRYEKHDRMRRWKMQQAAQHAIAASGQQHFNPSFASSVLPAELDGGSLITIHEMSNKIYTEALVAPPKPSTDAFHQNCLDTIDLNALIKYDDGLVPVETENNGLMLDYGTDSLGETPPSGDYGLLYDLQNLHIPELVETNTSSDQQLGRDVEMSDGSSASTCN